MSVTIAPQRAGADAPFPDGLPGASALAIDRFRASVAGGAPWAHALLAAVGEWSAPSEVVDGVELEYLIGGEAFDWLLLAERLLRALPEEHSPGVEAERLLFAGTLPAEIDESAFKSALGPEKYRAHLNYFYGVVVEEALWHAVEREIEKERGVRGLRHPFGVQDLVAERLYRADLGTLLRQFQREQGKGRRIRLTLGEWRAFTYWLFERRLRESDRARAASDTRKGLRMLRQIRGAAEPA